MKVIVVSSRCGGLAAMTALALGWIALPALANPAGGTVAQGSATITSQGVQLTVQTSDKAQINWSSFNIGLGETTTFVQPSASSVVWNQINDANPSQILGNLNANGYVILQNPSGFYVGGQAVISTHGLVMTTSPTPAPDLSSGGAWQFNTPPPTASIINYGQLRQPDGDKGGSIFLIGADIQNHGSISAPQGNIGLYAGKEVMVSTSPDGRGLSAKVTLPQGSVDNQGQLIADAGTIAIHAQVVNQGGLVQANSVRNVNGVIELVASDSLNLQSGSSLSAQGDATSGSASQGGFVVAKSGKTFADVSTSAINVSGKTQGQNGLVEIFGNGVTKTTVQSQIDGQSAASFLTAGGLLLINPQNITLSTAASTPSTTSPKLNLSDLSSFSRIDLFAAGNINLNSSWTLPNSQDPGAFLNLVAGNNITIADGCALNLGRSWAANLFAGPDNLASAPAAGTDGIYLIGSASLQAQDGDLNLWAANEVLVATGSSIQNGYTGIRTLSGGDITVTAEFGNIDTGSNPSGSTPYGYLYHSTAPYYTVSPSLSGISTAAGGNVMLNAGGNVSSYLPVSSSGSAATADAGSGAFGSQPGNVSVTAGGSVFGHYVLANGVGTITAGLNIGASRNVALSLVKGSWTLNAPNGNIYLQEVRNPNGMFNNVSRGRGGSPGLHLFDYDPQSSVTLDAGLGVYLTDASIPRPNGAVPVVFAPSLYVTAGSGGVVLSDDVTLFPSPYGNLQITTTQGGNFSNDPKSSNAKPELLMSDSSQSQWLTAGTFNDADHGTGTPPELNNPNPVVVNISGNMQGINLITTKRTQLTVGGDMINSGFSGENLNPGDVTSINVAGQIYDRSAYTFEFLSQSIPAVPAADVPPGQSSSWDLFFALALNPSKIAALKVPANLLPSQWASYALSSAGLFTSSAGNTGNPGFVYNASTKRFGYSGQMSPVIAAELSGPLTVLRYGPGGYPLLDASGHFVTDQIHWVASSAVQALFAATQGAPSAATPGPGIQVGGPGTLEVNAGSISLGNSLGILSWGVGLGYGRLAPLSLSGGATVDVTIQGNLDMLTSTIAALGGGDVNVTSLAGALNLGSQELFGQPFHTPGFGIFTSGKGDVNVTAAGDINVSGSRIAAFNGGNIKIESLNGDVNAGSGGATFVSVPVSYVNPASGLAETYQEAVFGSGILATTLVRPQQVPGSPVIPGDITVITRQGNIYASQGGILQEALNGNVAAGPTVTLIAGTPASGGSPGHVGNIDLGDSGVIGGTIIATANGNITGLVISRQNSTIDAAQSFSGTVLSGGSANLTAGGSISGTIIGIAGVTASGGAGVSGATILSQSVSVGSGPAQSTLGTSTTGTSVASSAAGQADKNAQENTGTTASPEDDQKKKDLKRPTLVRRSRVTVILPPA